MWIELSAPRWLLLLPVCGGLLYLIWRRRPGKGVKARLSLWLHGAVAALLALALAGVSVSGGAGQKTAWLLLDVSASMARAPGAEEAAAQALSALEGRRAGVIVYGKNAMVEQALQENPVFSGVAAQADPSASDLNGALALAAALLPSDTDGGVAVISDDLLSPVDSSALAARGVAVNALRLSAALGRDAQVSRVSVPAHAYQGQRVPITVTVHASQGGEATLLLYENHAVAAVKEVTLRAGENAFAFEATAEAAGVVTYEAQVVFPGDTVEQNNRLGAYARVSGVPGILLAEGAPGEGEELKKLLSAAGMRVETVPPAMLPDAPEGYTPYQAVALANVDADSLSAAQISALEGAARELGRGVAVFGGDSSYALGNYRGSALEDMLPVTIDVKNQMELPSAALVLALDKSGSMTAGQYGVTRLNVAKEAACRALETLTEKDFAGVIAFDDAGKWAVPLAPVTDAAAMQKAVGAIRADGGTSFYTPLRMACDALKGVSAQYKHVIFLTDGEAGDTGYEKIVQEMAQSGVTLTTVAVGEGADAQGLALLAQAGGGRAYVAGEFDNVPKIFAKETLLISGRYVQNRVFTPVVTDESMTDFSGFPTLSGYLATTEKPLATVSLASDREEPILAWWQYGAGRVLCWTSDTQGAWSEGFLRWEQAAAFFGGMMAFVLPQEAQAGEVRQENGRLCYTAPEGAEGRAEARILAPDGSALALPLERVSQREYEAAWEAPAPGAYAVKITLTQENSPALSCLGGVATPYAREYDLRTAEGGALERLCRETGGSLTENPQELLRFPPSSARARVSLTPWLTALALLLLLADIAQRRLDWAPPGGKAAPRAPSASPKPSPKPKAAPASPPPAAEQLWKNLQKRKRM